MQAKSFNEARTRGQATERIRLSLQNAIDSRGRTSAEKLYGVRAGGRAEISPHIKSVANIESFLLLWPWGSEVERAEPYKLGGEWKVYPIRRDIASLAHKLVAEISLFRLRLYMVGQSCLINHP